jgi:hypothetical protein
MRTILVAMLDALKLVSMDTPIRLLAHRLICSIY